MKKERGRICVRGNEYKRGGREADHRKENEAQVDPNHFITAFITSASRQRRQYDYWRFLILKKKIINQLFVA